MSEKNRTFQIIHQYYEAFNHKNWNAFFNLLTEDIVHDVNQGGQEIGKKTFHHFMEKMNRCYDEKATDIVIFTSDSPDRAAAEFMIHGKYLATDHGLPAAHGQTYSVRCGTFFELEGDKISRVTTYYNLKEWLAQVQ